MLWLAPARQMSEAPELPLPVEFGADLADARIARIGDNPKARTTDVPARIHELRVVKDIEEFETEIEGEILLDDGVLQDAEIRVVEAGTMEEAAVGSPECSRDAILRECAHTR